MVKSQELQEDWIKKSRWWPQRARGKQREQWLVPTVAEPPAPGICSPEEPQARTRWRSGAGGMVSTYRVAVLGARGVGKSAIVRQFLYNEFSEVCVPTTARRLYLPAVVMNGHVHDLQILDFPPISAFPVNTLQVSALVSNQAMGKEKLEFSPLYLFSSGPTVRSSA